MFSVVHVDPEQHPNAIYYSTTLPNYLRYSFHYIFYLFLCKTDFFQQAHQMGKTNSHVTHLPFICTLGIMPEMESDFSGTAEICNLLRTSMALATLK